MWNIQSKRLLIYFTCKNYCVAKHLCQKMWPAIIKKWERKERKRLAKCKSSLIIKEHPNEKRWDVLSCSHFISFAVSLRTEQQNGSELKLDGG